MVYGEYVVVCGPADGRDESRTPRETSTSVVCLRGGGDKATLRGVMGVVSYGEYVEISGPADGRDVSSIARAASTSIIGILYACDRVLDPILDVSEGVFERKCCRWWSGVGNDTSTATSILTRMGVGGIGASSVQYQPNKSERNEHTQSKTKKDEGKETNQAQAHSSTSVTALLCA